jgi:hypothetical protein
VLVLSAQGKVRCLDVYKLCAQIVFKSLLLHCTFLFDIAQIELKQKIELLLFSIELFISLIQLIHTTILYREPLLSTKIDYTTYMFGWLVDCLYSA